MRVWDDELWAMREATPEEEAERLAWEKESAVNAVGALREETASLLRLSGMSLCPPLVEGVDVGSVPNWWKRKAKARSTMSYTGMPRVMYERLKTLKLIETFELEAKEQE